MITEKQNNQIPNNRKLYLQEYKKIRIPQNSVIRTLRKIERITKNNPLEIETFGHNQFYHITRKDISYFLQHDHFNNKTLIVLNHFLKCRYQHKTNINSISIIEKDNNITIVNNLNNRCNTHINENGYSFNVLKKEFNKIYPKLNKSFDNDYLNNKYIDQKTELAQEKYKELITEINALLH